MSPLVTADDPLSILPAGMRIVHIVDRLDVTGGVQTYLAGLLPALRERGIESVVFSAFAPPESFAGAEAVHVPAVGRDGSRLPAAGASQLAEALEAARPSLVYVHVAPSPDVARIASARASVVVYAHDYLATCPGNARYLHRSETFCAEGAGLRCFVRAYTERTTNRRPDRLVRAYGRVRAWRDAWPHVERVLVAAPFMRDVLVAGGAPADRIRVVPYWVEPTTPVDAPKTVDALFVGRLVASKGVGTLLDALARTPGATAAIAGDGPARSELERRSAELGLTSRVRFVGWVSRAERERLLAESRIFVVPSLWDEPFGISGLEALAAGVPVVATDVGGIPSWLTDGEAGLRVPRGDAAALGSALRRLIGDEGERAQLAAQGPTVAKRFSRERHLQLLLTELEAAQA